MLTHSRPGTTVPIVTGRRRTLLGAVLAVLALLAAVAGATAATPQQTTRRDHAAAQGAATRILNELVLPAGSTPTASNPGGEQLRAPVARPLERAQVDDHRFWTTTASMKAVLRSIQAHLPSGTDHNGEGTASSFMFAQYELPPSADRRLSQKQLVVYVESLSNGRTAVRADAQVVYWAPRPAAERIPAAARFLEISRTGGSMGAAVRRTVTDRAQVARLRRIGDALPLEARSIEPYSCPAEPVGVGIVTFSFRARAGGPTLAQIVTLADTPTTDDPCSTTTFDLHGQKLPYLLRGGRLLRAADRLLGLSLTES